MSPVNLRAPVLWVLFVIFSVLMAILGLRLLVSAYSTFDLELSFSREDALAAALEFRTTRFPDLATGRTATQFNHNQQLQAYVELEGGGFQRYRELVGMPDAAAQYWVVRQFAEGQEPELSVAYSPAGEPLSFAYRIPDAEPGAALSQADAQALAESGAEQFLGARFLDYALLEASNVRQTSGRLDHQFTFEHQALLIEEARVRLEVRVAGEQLVSVTPHTHIPAAFGQRFSEMRALNNQISQVSTLAMAALLGLGGLVIGGIWLHRRGSLHWRPALLPSAFIGIGLGAAVLGQLPLTWMSYQTTDPAANFLLIQIVAALVVMLLAALLFAIIYAVAEGVSRLAFPHHPRLYDFFRPTVAAAPEIRARVMGAYCYASGMLLYAGLFALLAMHFLGWWTPALPQQDPNILANWRPALPIIFSSLQAGFWEESLFRAIPLGLASLIGARLGCRKTLVVAVLILQAIIFAGVHANYPQLPGYYRLVELFLPALGFGILYLRFGLMVCILAHFQYNLILMSALLFSVDAPELWLDRTLVILAFLAPLLVLVWARVRAGNIAQLDPHWRNDRAQSPGSQAPSAPPITKPEAAPSTAGGFMLQGRWLYPLAAASVVAIALHMLWPGNVDWPEYQINRAEAKTLARDILVNRGVELTEDWRATVHTSPGRSQAREFVRDQSGPEVFQQLLGTYLDLPTWAVTWRNFGGPVEGRSERWQVWLNTDGSLQQVAHRLPEAAPGADLDRDTALAQAGATLQELGWGDPEHLEISSVNQNTRPARSDWSITYADRDSYYQSDGEAIVRIKLAGDEVVDYMRTINVPNHWQRTQAEQQSGRQPFQIAALLVTLTLLVVALSQFLRRRGEAGRLRLRFAWPWLLVCVSGAFMLSVLWADGGLSTLDTTGSWNTQIAIMLSGWLLQAALTAVLVFLAAQALYAERPLPTQRPVQDYRLGACLALMFGGLHALGHMLLPSGATPAPYAADYGSYMPWLTSIVGGFSELTSALIMLLVALGLARFLTHKSRWAIIATLAILWLTATVLAHSEPQVELYRVLIRILKVWAMVLLIRQRRTGIAIVVATLSVAISRLGIVNAIYPGAGWHALLAAASTAMVVYGLLVHWYRHTQQQPPGPHHDNGRA